jgi:transposase
MGTKKTGGRTAQRNRWSAEFKQQALLRGEKEGVPAVARDLGLEPAQLYAWRSAARKQGHSDEAQRLQQSELARLRRELARVEEENAFLKKAAAYFAKQPK